MRILFLKKKIDYNYLNELKDYFEKLILKNKKLDEINTLKYLTSSLYISLLDFHEKKYTPKFLDIAYKLI